MFPSNQGFFHAVIASIVVWLVYHDLEGVQHQAVVCSSYSHVQTFRSEALRRINFYVLRYVLI